MVGVEENEGSCGRPVRGKIWPVFERVAEGVEGSNRGDEMGGGGIVVRGVLSYSVCVIGGCRRLPFDRQGCERTIDEWPLIVERMNQALDGWWVVLYVMSMMLPMVQSHEHE
jgi:hypothetical protein